MATIREQFVKACIDAMSMPREAPEIQRGQAKMAERLANSWIANESIEFKLFKLGHAAGRAEQQGG